jgi:hypothetical protein
LFFIPALNLGVFTLLHFLRLRLQHRMIVYSEFVEHNDEDRAWWHVEHTV